MHNAQKNVETQSVYVLVDVTHRNISQQLSIPLDGGMCPSLANTFR